MKDIHEIDVSIYIHCELSSATHLLSWEAPSINVRIIKWRARFGIDVVFWVACRSNLEDRKDTYQREHTVYEDPDTQSDDLFFADTRRKKVIVESQQDDTDDLFDALLQDEAVSDKRGDEDGSVHNDEDNSHE